MILSQICIWSAQTDSSAGRGLYFASVNLLSTEPGVCVHGGGGVDGGLKTIIGDLYEKRGT